MLRPALTIGNLARTLFSLLLCTAVLTGCEGVRKAPGLLEVLVPPGPTELTVVTYNIRYGTASDGENRWDNRRAMLVASIRRLAPDVLCLQEALGFQIDYLQRELGMASLGVGRDDGRSAGEFSAILYRSDRLTAERQRTFWFSDTPEKPGSRSWGNSIPRICTFAQFADPVTGRRFKVFNLHLDHQGEPSRNRSVELLAQATLDTRALGVPVIVAGDFNATPESAALRYMRGEAGSASGASEAASSPRLIDTLAAAGAVPPAAEAGTFHDFKGRTDGQRIDFILTDRVIETSSAGIDRFSEAGRFPSDHFAVWAKLRLK